MVASSGMRCFYLSILFTLPVCEVEMYNKNLPTYAEPSPVSPQRRENALDSSIGVDVQTLIILAIERVLLSASRPDDRKFIRADVL